MIFCLSIEPHTTLVSTFIVVDNNWSTSHDSFTESFVHHQTFMSMKHDIVMQFSLMLQIIGVIKYESFAMKIELEYAIILKKCR